MLFYCLLMWVSTLFVKSRLRYKSVSISTNWCWGFFSSYYKSSCYISCFINRFLPTYRQPIFKSFFQSYYLISSHSKNTGSKTLHIPFHTFPDFWPPPLSDFGPNELVNTPNIWKWAYGCFQVCWACFWNRSIRL